MLKVSFVFLLGFLTFSSSYAQNTFPASGNVGIGTSSPLSKFAIFPLLPSGTNVATAFIAGDHGVLGNTAGSYLYPFEFQHWNTGNIDRFQISPYRRVAGTAWEGTSYRLQFAVDNTFTEGTKAYIEVGASDPNLKSGGLIAFGTEGIDRLVVTSAGFVGIGTISPKEALSVNGAIRSKSVKVETANWPDYVFKKEYELPSLSEVKSYIERNRHLPEMPSEQEMIKNGIDLGETNKLLLKKVEELTLYLLELKSENEKINEKLKRHHIN